MSGYPGRELEKITTGSDCECPYLDEGYTQKEGINYHATFAPVAKFSTIRTLFAVAAIRKLNVKQLDISTAYLNAKVHEDIYMAQPEGFTITGPNQERMVCKLEKSLYGLKQSGRNWTTQC